MPPADPPMPIVPVPDSDPASQTLTGEERETRERELAHRFFEKGVHVTAVTLVQRSAIDLYRSWREFEHLPRFVEDLVRVEIIDDKTSRWTAEAAFNGATTLQWTAELINDRPGEIIAWRTTRGSEVEVAGSVRFRDLPSRRGAEVRIVLEYVPPVGRIADTIAKAFLGDAKSRVRAALHRFRQVMETGEIAVAQGQPAGQNRWRADRPGEERRKTDADVRDIAETMPGRLAEGEARTPIGGVHPAAATRTTNQGQVHP